MSAHFFSAARAALVVCGVMTPIALVSAAEANLPGPDSSAAELVTAALQSELSGPSDLRSALLKQALERDPNFAPARWQSGFVRYDERWLTLDEVARRVAADPTLAEYRKRRDALIDRADDHRALAAWCHKHRLADLERIHWAKVLEFDAQDAEAIAALGLQLYEGRLLAPQQIEAAKQRAIEARQALKRWQPQMVKWRKAISAGRGPECNAALEALEKLDDPEAIPALEVVFAENGASKKNDEWNRLLIETVGRMLGPEATDVLLRRALVPESQQVREGACDQLKKRPMFAYVPQLIAMLPGTIKTKFNVVVLPGGMVLHEHEVFIEGRQADVSLAYESLINPTDAITAMFVTPQGLGRELHSAATIEARARTTKQQLDWLRARIQFVLERTTGFGNIHDPGLWEKQYNDYNGWYTQPREKRSYQFASRNEQGYFIPGVHVTNTRTLVFRDPTIRMSCFPAGTPIITIDGPRRIEQIAVGDRVLSQDVETGELNFQPVQARTLRPSTDLLQISCGSKTVVATLAHPFWSVGTGWRTAKSLKVGEYLHRLGGAVVIDAIDNVRPSEVYNLVVGNLHNYFVGEDCLLVHDNSPLSETSTLVPGLSASAEAP